jgi:hypothetical protein
MVAHPSLNISLPMNRYLSNKYFKDTDEETSAIIASLLSAQNSGQHKLARQYFLNSFLRSSVIFSDLVNQF